MKIKFNRNPIWFGTKAEVPSQSEIKTTPGLYNASLDDAVKFGGDVVRQALRAVNVRNDRKYVAVDVKVHMLMPGFMPAIPGWHTDGAPRALNGNPIGPLPPDLLLQENLMSSHYHLLVFGDGCNTKFLTQEMDVEVPSRPTTDLYKIISEQVERASLPSTVVPSGVVAEWDWWNLHTAVVATKKEWRFLMRVTESDFLSPERDLRQVIRTQHQVYVPTNFGW